MTIAGWPNFGTPELGQDRLQDAGRIMQALFATNNTFENNPFDNTPFVGSLSGGVIDRLQWIQDNMKRLMPAGTVITSASINTPDGFLPCDGSILSTADYPELFDAISNTYGGDGINTFGLPDTRGIFVRGVGQPTNAVFSYKGEDVALGEMLDDTFQSHRMGSLIYEFMYADGNHTSQNGGGAGLNVDGRTPTTGDPVSNGYGTPRTGYETRPKSIGLNYFIKY